MTPGLPLLLYPAVVRVLLLEAPMPVSDEPHDMGSPACLMPEVLAAGTS